MTALRLILSTMGSGNSVRLCDLFKEIWLYCMCLYERLHVYMCGTCASD